MYDKSNVLYEPWTGHVMNDVKDQCINAPGVGFAISPYTADLKPFHFRRSSFWIPISSVCPPQLPSHFVKDATRPPLNFERSTLRELRDPPAFVAK